MLGRYIYQYSMVFDSSLKSRPIYSNVFLKTWQPRFFQSLAAVGQHRCRDLLSFSSFFPPEKQNTKIVETRSNPLDSGENFSNRIPECTESGARLFAVCRGEYLIFFRTPCPRIRSIYDYRQIKIAICSILQGGGKGISFFVGALLEKIDIIA